MDAHFHGLPPLKRFRILQQREQRQQLQDDNSLNSQCLPAKKRKESRESINATSIAVDCSAASAAPTSTYCLPAKKRVWAFPPDFDLEKEFSPFDLNVEYKPPVNEESIAVAASEEKDPPEHYEKKSIEKICEENETTGFVDEELDADAAADSDDGILCAICQSTDGDPSDPIVFCDGCDLMVHASCYGNPLVKGIPEGDWFCVQCLASPSSHTNETADKPFSCCLCPIKEGATKPTKNGQWAHVVCAVFVPEAFFDDPEGREGIDCSKIPKRRWKQECYICKSSNGCAIDCSELKCPLAFHVSCGLKEDLSIEYREGRKKGAIVAGFCKDHTELWVKQQQTGKFKIVAREE